MIYMLAVFILAADKNGLAGGCYSIPENTVFVMISFGSRLCLSAPFSPCLASFQEANMLSTSLKGPLSLSSPY